MSWLYSQALVAEYLGENFSDGEPSAPLNGNPTQQAYCAPDKMTAFSRLSRFGMTFKPLTEDRGEELLTLYLAGFHARTLVQQGKAQELTENDQECGDTWRGWLAKYDPDTSSWRTAQCSLLEDLNESLATLPRSGMTRNGLLWELPMLGQITSETESGLLLPTPTCHNAKEGAHPSEYNRNTPTLATHAGGQLNPTWVEWLMGWPLGWTDLKPLETVKSHSVQQKLGDC
jgi:hypothetical protein